MASRWKLRFLVIVSLPLIGAGDPIAGKEIYEGFGRCSSCHGLTGGGESETGVLGAASFADAAYRLDTDADGQVGTDLDLANVITQGAAVFGGSALMLPQVLDPQQVDDVIAYIRTLESAVSVPTMPIWVLTCFAALLLATSFWLIQRRLRFQT